MIDGRSRASKWVTGTLIPTGTLLSYAFHFLTKANRLLKDLSSSRFNSLPFLSTAELTQRILKAAYIIRTLTPALNILAAFCQAPIIVLCMMYVMYCHLAFREPQNPLQDIDNPPMAEVPLSEETNHGDAGVEDA